MFEYFFDRLSSDFSKFRSRRLGAAKYQFVWSEGPIQYQKQGDFIFHKTGKWVWDSDRGSFVERVLCISEFGQTNDAFLPSKPLLASGINSWNYQIYFYFHDVYVRSLCLYSCLATMEHALDEKEQIHSGKGRGSFGGVSESRINGRRLIFVVFIFGFGIIWIVFKIMSKSGQGSEYYITIFSN